jgi:hypothetical protein
MNSQNIALMNLANYYIHVYIITIYKYIKYKQASCFNITVNACCFSSDNGLSGGITPHYYYKLI